MIRFDIINDFLLFLIITSKQSNHIWKCKIDIDYINKAQFFYFSSESFSKLFNENVYKKELPLEELDKYMNFSFDEVFEILNMKNIFNAEKVKDLLKSITSYIQTINNNIVINNYNNQNQSCSFNAYIASDNNSISFNFHASNGKVKNEINFGMSNDAALNNNSSSLNINSQNNINPDVVASVLSEADFGQLS